MDILKLVDNISFVSFREGYLTAQIQYDREVHKEIESVEEGLEDVKSELRVLMAELRKKIGVG